MSKELQSLCLSGKTYHGCTEPVGVLGHQVPVLAIFDATLYLYVVYQNHSVTYIFIYKIILLYLFVHVIDQVGFLAVYGSKQMLLYIYEIGSFCKL